MVGGGEGGVQQVMDGRKVIEEEDGWVDAVEKEEEGGRMRFGKAQARDVRAGARAARTGSLGFVLGFAGSQEGGGGHQQQ